MSINSLTNTVPQKRKLSLLNTATPAIVVAASTALFLPLSNPVEEPLNNIYLIAIVTFVLVYSITANVIFLYKNSKKEKEDRLSKAEVRYKLSTIIMFLLLAIIYYSIQFKSIVQVDHLISLLPHVLRLDFSLRAIASTMTGLFFAVCFYICGLIIINRQLTDKLEKINQLIAMMNKSNESGEKIITNIKELAPEMAELLKDSVDEDGNLIVK